VKYRPLLRLRMISATSTRLPAEFCKLVSLFCSTFRFCFWETAIINKGDDFFKIENRADNVLSIHRNLLFFAFLSEYLISKLNLILETRILLASLPGFVVGSHPAWEWLKLAPDHHNFPAWQAPEGAQMGPIH